MYYTLSVSYIPKARTPSFLLSLAEATNNPNDPAARRNLFLRVAVIAALAAFIWAGARAARPAEPSALCEAREIPYRPHRTGGSWTWIERTAGKPSRLLRSADGRAVEIAPSVVSFDATDRDVVWAAQESKRWTVFLKRDDGTPQNLRSSTAQIAGVKLAGESVFWLEKRTGLEPSSPLPPLSDLTELWSIAAAGGEPRRVASLLETEPGEILGVRGEDVIVSAPRSGFPGATAIYSVSTETGAVRRLAGDSGRNPAVLTESGEVCWSAPSRESSQADGDTSVRCRDASGAVTTRVDWLGHGGQMFASGDRAFYVDADMNPSAWPAQPGGGLPHSLPIQAGFGVAGLSRGKVLLFRRVSVGVKLYEVDIP